nr:EAL domain-containing protein [Croceicoccus hydrothermalis]
MQAPHPFALNEQKRLAALAELAILDSQEEEEFDAVTRLVASIFDVSSAAVSLVDKDRQWFKARYNIAFEQTPRDIAFCDQVVAHRKGMVVSDTHRDARFAANPLVTEAPHIRFYAGAPLYLRSGHCVGSLCVIDTRPRHDFDADKFERLHHFAAIVSELIEARKSRREADIAAKVVTATPDAVLAANRKAEIVYYNDAAAKLFGWSAQEALGKNVTCIIPDDLRAGHQFRFERAARGGATRLVGKFVELQARRSDGSVFPVELSLAPWGDEAHGGFAAIIRDISKRKALQADRLASKRFLDAVVSNLPLMLFVKDAATGQYLLLNKEAENLLGRPPGTMLGKVDDELFPGREPVFRQNDLGALKSGNPECSESAFERDDGSVVNIRTTRVLIDGPDRPGQYLLGLSEDLTEMRQSEAERLRLARFDSLTGLINRASFLEQAEDLVGKRAPFAMLSVDIDRFKAINDQFGHAIGDRVLERVGKRLLAMADDGTSIARVGGNEFTCLLTGRNLRSRARTLSHRLFEDFETPCRIDAITVAIRMSVGVVIYPDDGNTIETLRQNADLAMYRAKLDTRGEPCFFDDAMDTAQRDRLRLETKLRNAIAADRIETVYQPIVSVDTGAVVGMEALARWTDMERGPVPADLFISVAEDCDLIDELGENILRRACLDAKSWPDDVRVCVNLSPRQFYSGKLLKTIADTLNATGLPASRLQLEITENLVMENADEAFAQLERMKQMGIGISVDDFGIGYSSLGYFQKFCFDTVKIDKSFIREIESSQAAKAIVTAVVGLARQLSMSVVAEGVETQRQRDMLARLGVSHLQGYLFSAPVKPGGLDRLLAKSFAD